MAPLKVAVLDDYRSLSNGPFSSLDPAKYTITTFTDTLPPYAHPSTPDSAREELVQRLLPFEIISTMRERTPFPAALVARLPNLKLLLTTGTRNGALSLPDFAARSIPVAGTPPAREIRDIDSTTQHCVALILALARGIPRDDAAVKGGHWQTGLAIGLAGKTFGVVGLGRLGACVARIMRVAFGMRIVAWSANLTQEKADERAREMGLPSEDGEGEKTFKVVSREELFKSADVVSLHLVLSDRSRGLVTSADLSLMKPTALFVNTSRGPLVVESDLVAHLSANKIAGAALDVFDVEPLPADSPWRRRDWGEGTRVVVTPHMGYVEEKTIGGWYVQQVENLRRWERGEQMECLL